ISPATSEVGPLISVSLEKSFDDSAKEREKSADTFPRDHPKAVPKRPNNKINRRGAHGRRSRVLIRI
ncbi:hypothetical protein, partial [Burkholderia sp. BC1]|uniref:hypothetical protein n=1 Tax=Burkholderia sp. BC1 TaxID=1095370 RepID=UPI004043A2CD